eukprot:m.117670 g.117670  ORF g.117670 m.117670 type:complete len:552 (-) comp17189_c0_seq1:186-1841(-)
MFRCTLSVGKKPLLQLRNAHIGRTITTSVVTNTDEKNFDRIITNGIIVTAQSRYSADVGIKDGRVTAIAKSLVRKCNDIAHTPKTHIIDAKNMLVLPGGVDSHCHIDQPSSSGGLMAGDWESATRAAAIGGTTTVIAFSTQEKGGNGVLSMVTDYHVKAAEKALIDYSFHMIVSDPTDVVLQEELPALIASGHRSIKIFMTYPKNRVDDAGILQLLDCARKHDALVCIHAENHDAIMYLTEKLVQAGLTSTKYHAWCKPPAVEREAVHRIITLAEITGAAIQIFHVTCDESAKEIRRAREERGVRVFAETCPHYLTHTANDLDAERARDGARFLCSPALRTANDHEALWRHIVCGTIDNVTSDHAPYNLGGRDGKFWAGDDAPFHLIANGAPGIQTRMPVLFSEGVSKKRIDVETFVNITSTNAAKIFGMYPQKGTIAVGSDADIVIWDPKKSVTISNDMIEDGVDYSPYDGFGVTGWPVLTLSRGRIVSEWDSETDRAKPTSRGNKPCEVLPGSGKFISRTHAGQLEMAHVVLPTPFDPVSMTVAHKTSE